MATVEEARKRMDEALDAIRREFASVRTGKATPALLDTVRVDAYGSKMPINQVATVSTPDATLILVQPFDKSLIGDIEKGIQAADLGLNPQNDGKLVRIPVPPLTEERRRELVKHTRKLAEDYRVSARNHRRDALEMLKELEKSKDITEDARRTASERVEALTKESIERLEKILKAKEEEIMAV